MEDDETDFIDGDEIKEGKFVVICPHSGNIITTDTLTEARARAEQIAERYIGHNVGVFALIEEFMADKPKINKRTVKNEAIAL